jgi:DNA-binding Xre family transcriptional regulator
MNTKTDSQLVLEALKILLKQQKLNYRALAKHLRISVPSVKRAMNSPEMPLSRIEEICSFLGLTLFEILETARRDSVDNFSFNQEQEEFLAANPHFFAYFEEIRFYSPDQIEQRHQISRRSTHIYLKKLESLRLLELHPNNEVKTKVRGQIIWDDHGPLGRTFSRAMILNMADRAAKKIGTPEKIFLELTGWKLTPAEYDELKRAYRETSNRFQALSSFNKRSKNQNASLDISAVTIADEWKDPFQLKVIEIGSVKL